MKYTINCYDTNFGLDLAAGLFRYDEVQVKVEAENNDEAIEKAKKIVKRKHYRVVAVE